MRQHQDAPPEVAARVRAICSGLPAAAEERAWVGTRWVVRRRSFAHLLTIEDGWPPAIAKAWGNDGPVTLLTFRAEGDDLDALAHVGRPFKVAHWGRAVVLMAIDDATDWEEVAELVTDSYCMMAPTSLADQVDRPQG